MLVYSSLMKPNLIPKFIYFFISYYLIFGGYIWYLNSDSGSSSSSDSETDDVKASQADASEVCVGNWMSISSYWMISLFLFNSRRFIRLVSPWWYLSTVHCNDSSLFFSRHQKTCVLNLSWMEKPKLLIHLRDSVSDCAWPGCVSSFGWIISVM